LSAAHRQGLGVVLGELAAGGDLELLERLVEGLHQRRAERLGGGEG